MVLLFHIMGVMRNLQMLSRPRAVLQGWGGFFSFGGGGLGSARCEAAQQASTTTPATSAPTGQGNIEPSASFLSRCGRSGAASASGGPGSATNAGSRRASLAAASSLSRRSVLAFLEAAPARPAAAFFSSFGLDVRLGADVVSAVTLKTGCAG